MNNFTTFKNFSVINEAKNKVSIDAMTIDDIKRYLEAVKKLIPSQVADIIYLTSIYELRSQKDIEDIRNANKSQLNKFAFKYNISQNEIEELWKNLKELKSNLRLLPQYQTKSERNAFMAGKLKMSDITIDLDTPSGRNACAKLYMSMVHKIVGDYIGKSNLEKPELMSAALQGFTDAMNDWRKNGSEENNVPFKTYAAYRVKQQILNDINTYSYAVKTNWYAVQKMGSGMLSSISLDGPLKNDNDDDFKQDRMKEVSEEPNYNLTKTEEDNWNVLYKLIEGKFKQRDVDIFYRYFGLKGYQKEKGKDIAKTLGISASYITGIINMILRDLKKDAKAMDILSDIQSSYNESLMFDVMNLSKNVIVETILADNTFILLEELTKWSNKNVYINSINSAFEKMSSKEIAVIEQLLNNDFEYLDKNFKKEKSTIIDFLSFMYPTESFKRKTDVSILEYMTELSDLYKKYYK